MNIHPLFVHFPVALLSIYSIMELLQFKKLRESHSWNIVKAVFVILGSLTSFLAIQTGELAEQAFGNSELVSVHSQMGELVGWFFGILAFIYLIRTINREFETIKNWLWNAKYIRNVWMVLSKITDILFKQWWIFIILGLMGLWIISVTGALGGAIVYGPDADPFVSFVYNFIF